MVEEKTKQVLLNFIGNLYLIWVTRKPHYQNLLPSLPPVPYKNKELCTHNNSMLLYTMCITQDSWVCVTVSRYAMPVTWLSYCVVDFTFLAEFVLVFKMKIEQVLFFTFIFVNFMCPICQSLDRRFYINQYFV